MSCVIRKWKTLWQCRQGWGTCNSSQKWDRTGWAGGCENGGRRHVIREGLLPSKPPYCPCWGTSVTSFSAEVLLLTFTPTLWIIINISIFSLHPHHLLNGTEMECRKLGVWRSRTVVFSVLLTHWPGYFSSQQWMEKWGKASCFCRNVLVVGQNKNWIYLRVPMHFILEHL